MTVRTGFMSDRTPTVDVGSLPRRISAVTLATLLACLAAGALLLAPSAFVTAGRGRSAGEASRLRSATALPLSLTPVVSASIGMSDRSFWLSRHGASLSAAGGGIRSAFTAAGVQMRVAAGTLGLSLTGVGDTRAIDPLGAAKPSARADEALYRYGSINESYRNGPYGLEQRFTVSAPKVPGAALVLALRTRGSLLPEQAGGQVVFKSRSGVTALRYGQLSALDASGRRLPAKIQLRHGVVQLQIDTRGARYPVRIDPFIQQGEKLTSTGVVGRRYFGQSVALSSDGNTALVGGPDDVSEAGSAWVFTRSGESWSQQGPKLKGGGEVGRGLFGDSVALSGDGNTALIGAPDDNGEAGAVWIFTRSGETWSQRGEKLTGGGEIGRARFGDSVAVSGDGTTALVGGPQDSGETGAAWVFARSGESWSQQGEKLTGAGEIGRGLFGDSVALSMNGSTALVGGARDDNQAGGAWVFTRTGEAWAQQGSKLTGAGEIGAGLFGDDVALSSNGSTALVGAEGDDSDVGAAWVFTRTGETWAQQGSKLTGSGESTGERKRGHFASSVALSMNGSTALIGGSNDSAGIGAVWLFTRSGETWTQHGSKLTAGGEVGKAHFANSIALSANGTTALIGGPNDSGEIGSAWVFVRSGEVWTQQGPKLTAGAMTGSAKFLGVDVALSANGDTAVVGGASNKKEVGAVWVFTRSGETWTQQGGELMGKGEVGLHQFIGVSVALSADGNTALIGGTSGSKAGAAWVFTRSGETWTQQGEPLSGHGQRGTRKFGVSVALSADGNTALIGGSHHGEIGAAWVFTRSGGVWTEQGERLEGSGEAGNGRFGDSVALSGDGDTALIGGSRDDGEIGAAWVFTRTGESWTQQGAKLTGAEETGEGAFGDSVALSSNGSTALIGGEKDDGDIGAAWVFTRTGGSWSQQGAKLTGAGESIKGAFGDSVALSSEGNTALIGGSRDDGKIGAAWDFTRTGEAWSQLGEKLTGAGESGQGHFGEGVALSADGHTAMVGGDQDDGDIGAAWAFTSE